jgi:hypothetical protein
MMDTSDTFPKLGWANAALLLYSVSSVGDSLRTRTGFGRECSVLKLEKNKILSKFDCIRKLSYGSFNSHIAYIVRA